MNDKNVQDNARVSEFNKYSEEFRTRVEGLIKQVLLISTGIQALTIGAFFNGSLTKVPVEVMPNLTLAWFFL